MSEQIEQKSIEEVPELNEETKGLIQSMANLIASKDLEIAELKKQNELLQTLVSVRDKPALDLYPSVQRLDFVGCKHDFPNPWFGTVPPSCTKCGYNPLNHLTVTCEGDTDGK